MGTPPRPSAPAFAAAASAAPAVPLRHLDALWFQVAGTVCNLRCSHCFISCSPDNHTFEFLSLQEVLRWLRSSVAWGVKEYYFTGGEPFMNRDLPAMLEETLEIGPATVLTNATLLRPRVIEELSRTVSASDYSLEIRVSIDGPSPEANDPVRGEGTFVRAMNGVRLLLEHGFLPIITAAQVWEPDQDESVRLEFLDRLRAIGYDRPRLKIIPTLRIGRESRRTRAYDPDERVTAAMLEGFDDSRLLCSNTRIISSRGVHVCPILIEHPDSRLGDTLEEAAAPFTLRHQACYTCWLHGAICSNLGGVGDDGA